MIRDVIESAVENVELNCRVDFSLAGLAVRNGLSNLETELVERAQAKARRLRILDYRGRAHETVNAFVDYLVAKGRTMEAVKVYLTEIRRHPTLVPAFYIETFEKFPKNRWPHIVKQGEFDSEEFAEGFISAIKNAVGVKDSHRAEVACRLGNILLHAGQFSAAKRLFRYSVEKGDPRGESGKFLEAIDEIARTWSEDIMWRMCR